MSLLLDTVVVDVLFPLDALLLLFVALVSVLPVVVFPLLFVVVLPVVVLLPVLFVSVLPLFPVVVLLPDEELLSVLLLLFCSACSFWIFCHS